MGISVNKCGSEQGDIGDRQIQATDRGVRFDQETALGAVTSFLRVALTPGGGFAALRTVNRAAPRPPDAAKILTSPQVSAPPDRSAWEGIHLFHESWWLDAAAPGEWTTLSAYRNDREVGILPVWKRTNRGFTWWTSPPLTHVLGPAIDLGGGNAHSRQQRRLSVTADLLKQIPRHCCFRQVVHSSVPDVLAFQAEGFAASPHYTILVDCSDLDKVWAGFRQSTRRFIRKAQDEFEVETWSDPRAFVDFYVNNLQGERLGWYSNLSRFEAVHEACRLRGRGGIFVARDKHKRPVGAVFAAWGHGSIYYVLATRDKQIADYGVISLIIWRLMAEAHDRGLTLDLDGVISEPVLKFLAGFGSAVVPRMTVNRYPQRFEVLMALRNLARRGNQPTFV
jgi:hypothetical protein